MPAELLDRLQEDKLRATDEFIDRYASGVFGNGKDRLAAAIADYIVDEGLGLRQALMRFWDYYWTAALNGKIPERREQGAKIRSLLDRGAVSLARAAAAARQGATLADCDVGRLALLEEQSKAFPKWIEECMARWELLDRPRKPLDRERTARAQTAFGRGECEATTDILARLHQGGSLVQE